MSVPPTPGPWRQSVNDPDLVEHVQPYGGEPLPVARSCGPDHSSNARYIAQLPAFSQALRAFVNEYDVVKMGAEGEYQRWIVIYGHGFAKHARQLLAEAGLQP